VVSLRQFHWVDLGAQEGNLGTLIDSPLEVISDSVAIRLVLLKHERSRVVTALEVRVICGAALVLCLRVEGFEANR
jgi:hypothetical protein